VKGIIKTFIATLEHRKYKRHISTIIETV